MASSMAMRLGFAAFLALVGSATAWATDGKPDARIAGGDVWFDEFYSATPVRPAAVTVPAGSRRAGGVTATGQHAQKRVHGADRAHARGHPPRLARGR